LKLRTPVFLTGWLRKSRLMTPDELARLKTDAEVLEQDAHGIKVLRLPSGDILKMFRIKRLVSSARLYSHARSFCRNADRLHALGIPTVAVRQLFHFPDGIHSAVLYQPLPGVTLRQLALAGPLDTALLRRIAEFVANLHRQGVLFRSLHFGNILQTSSGQLGLIDIADLGIRPFPLGCAARMRNFRHLCRLAPDRLAFGKEGWLVFLNAYRDIAEVRCNPDSFFRKATRLFDIWSLQEGRL
jgi:tRNA A-37 threonylcarbamoyl transferase component Bud32